MTMTTTEKKNQNKLVWQLLRHSPPSQQKKLSDIYFISWRQKITVKTDFSPPPWSFPAHSASQIEREGGREKKGEEEEEEEPLLTPSFLSQRRNWISKTSNSSAGAGLQAPSDHHKWSAHRGIRIGQAQRTPRNRHRQESEKKAMELLRLRPYPSSALPTWVSFRN